MMGDNKNLKKIVAKNLICWIVAMFFWIVFEAVQKNYNMIIWAIVIPGVGGVISLLIAVKRFKKKNNNF